MDVAPSASADGWVCEVTVELDGERTHHTVNVSEADLERWAGGGRREDVEDLVARSFDFLLQREPPASILRRFDLSAIRGYFPDYDDQFKLQA